MQPPQDIAHVEGLAAPNEVPPAVYFLCDGDQVVYVGQSLRVAARVREHEENKTFDRFFYLPLPSDVLEVAEQAWIRFLRPKYNRSNKRGSIPHVYRDGTCYSWCPACSYQGKPGALQPRVPTVALSKLEQNLQHAVSLGARADAAETVRTYHSHLRAWVMWCEDYGVSKELPIDPIRMMQYIAALDERGLKVLSIQQHCAALRRVHRDRELPHPFENPKVRAVLRGLARTRGTMKKQKKPLTPEILRAALPNLGIRDQAILVVGCVTGLRRSELVAVTWDDLEKVRGGYVLTVRKSKTDKEGKGAHVGIPSSGGKWCPVRLLDAWWEEAPEDSRIFPVCAETVNHVVKDAAAIAGEDPKEYGAHSMRAALATIAGEQGVSLAVSMIATRHKSADVAAGYVRKSEVVKNPAHAAVVEALG